MISFFEKKEVIKMYKKLLEIFDSYEFEQGGSKRAFIRRENTNRSFLDDLKSSLQM